jgi:hypothetical protein
MSEMLMVLPLGAGLTAGVVVVCTLLSRWLRRRRDEP